MAGLFGEPDTKRCCCEPGPNCSPCPPGTIYPWLVHIVIPSLGVDVLAGNELDPEEDGETEFIYRWEGTEDGYDSLSLWGECEYSVAIYTSPGGTEVCLANASASPTVNMTAISCPPDPLVLLYEVECSNGTTLEVYIME